MYIRGTVGVRRVRPKYAGAVLYAEAKLFLEMFNGVQRMRAYSINVTHTLAILTTYYGYAGHTL